MIAWFLGFLLLPSGGSIDSLNRAGHAAPRLVERTQSVMQGVPFLRLTTERSRFDVHADTVDSLGFLGLRARPGDPEPPHTIAWSELARVGTLHPSTVPGAIAGGIVGGVLAAAAVFGPSEERSGATTMSLVIVGGTLGGAFFGGQVGSNYLREHPFSIVVPWGTPRTLGAIARSNARARGPRSPDARAPAPDTPALASPPDAPAATSVSDAPASDPGERAPAQAAETHAAAGESHAAPTPGAARVEGPDPGVAATIHGGRRLRIRLLDDSEWFGRARRADATGLHQFRAERLEHSVRPIATEVPWSEIRRLDRECGRSGEGALWVGLGFGAFGAMIGAAAAGALGGSGEEMGGGAALGFAITGTIGAGLGAAIGAGFRHWKPVYGR